MTLQDFILDIFFKFDTEEANEKVFEGISSVDECEKKFFKGIYSLETINEFDEFFYYGYYNTDYEDELFTPLPTPRALRRRYSRNIKRRLSKIAISKGVKSIKDYYTKKDMASLHEEITYSSNSKRQLLNKVETKEMMNYL